MLFIRHAQLFYVINKLLTYQVKSNDSFFQLKNIKALHNQVIIKNKEITLIDLNNYKL